MSPLRVRRSVRPSRSSVALVAVLLILAGADLIHHVAAGHAGSHNAADICLAVVAGATFAVAVAVALSRLPRPSFGIALGVGSLCSPRPPAPKARPGPVRTVVLRL